MLFTFYSYLWHYLDYLNYYFYCLMKTFDTYSTVQKP